jgi:hypothetical protein
MAPSDVEGEVTSGSHEDWGNLDGSDASVSKAPAQDQGSGGESQPPPESGGTPQAGSSGGGVNLPVIILAGMMLLALAGVAVLANRGQNDSNETTDEIIFEPEEVSLDEGSATLQLDYEASVLGFKSNGSEAIPLYIIPYDEDETIEVTGYLSSTQRVDTSAMDQGAECWYNILHQVEYRVAGQFLRDECKFELTALMAPTSSEMLGHNCSVDFPGDYGLLFMSPPPEKIVFRGPAPDPATVPEYYSLSLVDVYLPRGINCPAFSR